MRLTALLLLVPAVASASGFYLTENGSKALMMGGAFAGQADDLSAMEHNPAGLAQLQGFNFMLDGQLVMHSIGFQRYDPGFDPANPPNTPAQAVSNTGGPFVVPMIGFGYGFKVLDRGLFVSLGLYGPPADGHYAFPAPKYELEAGKLVENARKTAPQRYSLIENTIFVVFPTLSIAYELIARKLMLGVSLQPVVTQFYFSQAVTSIDRFGIHPMVQSQEDPLYDSVVKVNLPWQLSNFTAVVGVLVRPVEMISVGVSYRPQVMINATGKLEITPGPIATMANTVVTGDKASLSLKLPQELKVGVHVQPISRLGINFDFIYQGWHSVQEIVLDPQDVSLSVMGGAPMKVAGFRIQKHWHDAYNFRLGAEFALFPWLSLYLGGWYETGAIPDEYIGVDFLHFSRVTFTGGAGLDIGKLAGFKVNGLELLVGAAGSPSSTHAVTTSEVRAGTTEPDPAPIVGAGVYTSSNFMFTFGIRGRIGGAAAPVAQEVPAETPPIPPAKEETAPAPAPAPTPAPAPEEAPKS